MTCRRPLAALVVMLYVLLAGVSVTCLEPPGKASHPGHHGKPAHSTLCAWACQFSFSDAIQASSPRTPLLVVLEAVAGPTATSLTSLPTLSLFSRGPPRI